ncbi:MAG: hypothetical protein JKY82_10830 [Rhizobiaceae bacterium]|nr:hypothetical protein [Rhizobiaceae bacterium]
MDELPTDNLSEHLTWLRTRFAKLEAGEKLRAGALEAIVHSLDTAITLSEMQFRELNVHRSMHVSGSNLAERNGQMN